MNITFKDAKAITFEDLTQEDPRDQTHELNGDAVIHCDGATVVVALAVIHEDNE